MNYNHQSTFSTVQSDSKQFLSRGFRTKDPRNTHSSKKSQQTHKVSPGHMVPGWSGSVPVQLIFFNSYILNTPFLYDKNLAWSLSFILNKIYEIFNTINTKTLVPSLLIWSRAGPGSIIENKSPLHTQNMPCSTSLICLKWKTNQLMDSINFFVIEN